MYTVMNRCFCTSLKALHQFYKITMAVNQLQLRFQTSLAADGKLPECLGAGSECVCIFIVVK